MFQICLFLQSLGKKGKRETEGNHFQNGHGEGVVLMKPDDDECFDDDHGTFLFVAFYFQILQCCNDIVQTSVTRIFLLVFLSCITVIMGRE